MKRLLFGFMISFLCYPVMADVYQYQDAEGNIVFTDKPVEGSFKRKLSDPTVIKFETPTLEVEKADNTAKNGDTQEAVAKPYTLFKIAKPESEATVKQDEGTVAITFDIKPDLQVKVGHKLIVALDGHWLEQKYSSADVAISNVDRGTHTLKAAIVDKVGKNIVYSQEITFYMKRFSKHFR